MAVAGDVVLACHHLINLFAVTEETMIERIIPQPLKISIKSPGGGQVIFFSFFTFSPPRIVFRAGRSSQVVEVN